MTDWDSNTASPFWERLPWGVHLPMFAELPTQYRLWGSVIVIQEDKLWGCHWTGPVGKDH